MCEVVTGEELHNHVRTLASDLDATVWVCSTCAGMEYASEAIVRRDDHARVVYLASSPDTTIGYLIALHELGHHATWDEKSRRLDSEADAWRWAIEQSLIPLGSREWSYIALSLDGYAQDRRYKRTPKFNDLMEEAITNAAVA